MQYTVIWDQKSDYNYVRYSRDFVVTVIVITEFDCISCAFPSARIWRKNLCWWIYGENPYPTYFLILRWQSRFIFELLRQCRSCIYFILLTVTPLSQTKMNSNVKQVYLRVNEITDYFPADSTFSYVSQASINANQDTGGKQMSHSLT